LASGKPIVAQGAEGIAELLADQPEQIVPLGDWPGFVDRIGVVASDLPLQLKLGKINRQRAESHFRLDQVIASYERLYSSLIEASQAPREGKSPNRQNNFK
jgi:glycosyltransferase involved in cell wall biosynthesis